jgi:hypothetical protein
MMVTHFYLVTFVMVAPSPFVVSAPASIHNWM